MPREYLTLSINPILASNGSASAIAPQVSWRRAEPRCKVTENWDCAYEREGNPRAAENR